MIGKEGKHWWHADEINGVRFCAQCLYGILTHVFQSKVSRPWSVCASTCSAPCGLAVDTVPFCGHTRPVTWYGDNYVVPSAIAPSSFARCLLDLFKIACFPLAPLAATSQRAFYVDPGSPLVSFAGGVFICLASRLIVSSFNPRFNAVRRAFLF